MVRMALTLSPMDAHNLSLATNAYYSLREFPPWRRNAQTGNFDANSQLWELQKFSNNTYVDFDFLMSGHAPTPIARRRTAASRRPDPLQGDWAPPPRPTMMWTWTKSLVMIVT